MVIDTPELEAENINRLEKSKFKESATNDAQVRVFVENEEGDAVPVVIAGFVADTLTMLNTSVPTAATEVSQALIADVKQVLIRSRIKGATLRIAFNSGETSTNYLTLNPRTNLVLDKFNITSQTLYFQSDIGSNTIEIVQWS